jgi:hypothetical protein
MHAFGRFQRVETTRTLFQEYVVSNSGVSSLRVAGARSADARFPSPGAFGPGRYLSASAWR